MPWVDVGGTDMHYLDAGSGVPLVLLHGALSSAETWYSHFEKFDAYLRCVQEFLGDHGL